MFPPLRFTITAVVATMILVVAASVPVVSYLLTQHSLPYATQPEVPQSLVDAGAEKFEQLPPAAAAAPSAIETTDPHLAKEARKPSEPQADAAAITVAKRPADPAAATATETTGSVLPAAKKMPVAAASAPANENPPAAELATANAAAATQVETPARTYKEIPIDMRAKVLSEQLSTTPQADTPAATVAAVAPTATETPAKPIETTASLPAKPDTKQASRPVAKKRAKRKRVHRRKVSRTRARPRRQARTEQRPQGLFSLLFGIVR